MTSLETLEIVKQMQKNWQDSINDILVVPKYHTDDGFCWWLFSNSSNKIRHEILSELKKDKVIRCKAHRQDHWYRTYDQIGKQALVTRLKHLNRTVERLEKQLKPID